MVAMTQRVPAGKPPRLSHFQLRRMWLMKQYQNLRSEFPRAGGRLLPCTFPSTEALGFPGQMFPAATLCGSRAGGPAGAVMLDEPFNQVFYPGI